MLNQYDDIGNFNVCISGQFDCSDIKDNGCHVNFYFGTGPDWKLISGKTEYSTTNAKKTQNSNLLVWGQAFNLTYVSTNLMGWPKLY